MVVVTLDGLKDRGKDVAAKGNMDILWMGLV